MNDLILDKNKLILSDNLINLLNVKEKDKLDIGYVEIDGKLFPSIYKSDGGKVLNKKNTISFRGKQYATLSPYGTNFTAELNNGNIILIGKNPEYITYTSVNKVLADLTKEVIEDRNYIINFNNVIL